MLAGRTTPRPKRAFALVALLFALGQLLGFAHLVAERHAVCREHGEMVHVAEHSHERHAARGPTDASDDGPAQDGPGHDEGSHCRVLANVASPTGIEPVADFVLIAAPDSSGSPVPTLVVPRAIETYAVAPKTSPPRA